MKNEFQHMLRKIVFFDVLVGTTLTIAGYVVARSYTFIFLLGLIIATINFVLNGIITNYLLLKKEGQNGALVILSFVVRVFFIALIGLLVFTHNKYNVVAYMFGYIAHFISLILYAISIKNTEGK